MSDPLQIAERLRTDVFTKPFLRPVLNKQHIFFDLLAHCSDNLDAEAKSSMYFLFTCYEKALAESRSGNMHAAAYWVSYIDKFSFALSDVADTGMKILYYPMLAFVDYANKEYTQALEQLENARDQMDVLIAKGFGEAMAIKMENALNTARVYFAMRDYDPAARHGGGLLAYLYAGNQSEFIYGISPADLFRQDPADINLYTDFYTDGVVRKMMEVYAVSPDAYRSVLYNITAQVLNEPWQYSPNIVFKPVFNMLHDYSRGNIDAFHAGLYENISQLPSCSRMLQFCMLDLFQSTLPPDAQVPDFAAASRAYCIDTLGIPPDVVLKNTRRSAGRSIVVERC